MRTFEGTFTIKWHKNDRGSMRGITIHCADRDELRKEQERIRNAFIQKGECPTVAHVYGRVRYVGVPAQRVTFDMTERR